MKICVIGSSGQLGLHLYDKFKKNKKINFISSKKSKINFLKGTLIQLKNLIFNLDKIKPNIIINCSAYTNVDKAEFQKKKTNLMNYKAVKILSEYSFKNNIYFIHFSTDYVYSGKEKKIWSEKDICKPINYYGYTKYIGENAIIKSKCNFIILRLSWLYGKFGNENFINKIINKVKSNNELMIVDDQIGSPTNTELVISVLSKLLIKIKQKKFITGVFNLCPKEFVNRYDLSKYIIYKYFDKKISKNIEISKIKTRDLNLSAKRPLNSRMNINKIQRYLKVDIKNWKFYLDKYLKGLK